MTGQCAEMIYYVHDRLGVPYTMVSSALTYAIVSLIGYLLGHVAHAAWRLAGPFKPGPACGAILQALRCRQWERSKDSVLAVCTADDVIVHCPGLESHLPSIAAGAPFPYHPLWVRVNDIYVPLSRFTWRERLRLGREIRKVLNAVDARERAALDLRVDEQLSKLV